MKNDGEIDLELGYLYKKNENEYYKFHVDDHIKFQKMCSKLEYGGYLSVRKPPNCKPSLILGQDKCIFCQFIFSQGFWCCPDGTKQLIPKDDGHGVMLSSFTCREFGYGYKLCKYCLSKINKMRDGQTYADKDAAKKRYGPVTKQPLLKCPFVCELEYGNSLEGYWSYEHMIIQLEDIVDCLKCLHPKFDIVVLVDHSNGHDRLQPDGLNINRINIKHGGKQPKMRNTLITRELLGPFHTPSSPLQVGMYQQLQFTNHDSEPCYLSNDEKVKHRYDIHLGEI